MLLLFRREIPVALAAIESGPDSKSVVLRNSIVAGRDNNIMAKTTALGINLLVRLPGTESVRVVMLISNSGNPHGCRRYSLERCQRDRLRRKGELPVP